MYASEVLVSCIDMKAKLSDNYGGEEMECAPCAPPKGQVCEDCEQKRPSWNVPGAAGNKYRWCAECGQKHAGAVKVKVTAQSKCEDCGQKQPTWNVPGAAGKKYRWCAECGQKHAGAVDQHAEAAALYRRSCAEEYKTLRGELMADAGDGSGQCECAREGCKCRQNAAAVVVATNQAPSPSSRT